jgi:hypothetical protein
VNTTVDFGFPNSAEEETDEMTEILESVSDSINNLFRIFMVIRDCVETDRKTNSTWTSSLINSERLDSEHDVAHVKEKLPALVAKGKEWLAVRLGNTIAQRRQYLKYCLERHEKAGEQRENHSELTPSPSEKPKSQQEAISSPEQEVSQASTEELIARDNSSNQSDSSNEISVEEIDSGSDLQVISLQDVSKGQSCFDCIYCWQRQTHKRQKAWR